MKKQLKAGGFVLAVMVTLTWAASGVTPAQTFPAKPVTLVIPFGAGGSHDLTARALASVGHNYLGQPLVVQLKPGGGGAIASDFVAQSSPDGYTLLFGGTGPNSTLPAVEGRYKGPNDLVAVCLINYSAGLIVTRPDAPYKTLKEMVAWAKANPGKIAFGNSGPWGAADVPWKMIMKETGIETKNIPHSGGGPALVAILGGHIDVTGAFTAQAFPHIQAGKLVPMFIMDENRHPMLPNVPTAREGGVNVVFQMWRGVLVPKGTPQPIIEKLAEAFKKMAGDPSAKALINQLGDEIYYLGPAEFTKAWRGEYEAQKELGKIFKN